MQLDAGVKAVGQEIVEIGTKHFFYMRSSLGDGFFAGIGPAGPGIGHGVVIDQHGDVAIGACFGQSEEFGAVDGPRPDAADSSLGFADEGAGQGDSAGGNMRGDEGAAELAFGLSFAEDDEVKHG